MKSKLVSNVFLVGIALIQGGSAYAFGHRRHPVVIVQPAPAPVPTVIVTEPAPPPVVIVEPAPQPTVIVEPAPAPAPAPIPEPTFEPAPAPIPDPVAQQQDIPRITSVNGAYHPNHSPEIGVRPGDIVTLSADLLDANNGYQALGANVEDFVWRANDKNSDYCDGEEKEDCLVSSNFQVNDYGVSFYVPYNMGKSITLTLSSHNPNSRDERGEAYTDTITLSNELYVPNYVAPTVIITEASQYHYDRFQPEFALAGQGRWVTIGETRFWSPYSYVTTEQVEWVPYQHGYWTWNDISGWTWVSYDPWGWVTDHYGCWRHHGVYGWIWMPSETLEYRPHCVTWFHDGEHVGWYPYHEGFRDGYRHGEAEGFNDGYWAGREAAEGYGREGYRYRPGYTIVRGRDVTNVNIVTVIENRHEVSRTTVIETNTSIAVITNSYRSNSFAPYPGGNDMRGSREFIQARVATPIPVTHVVQVSGPGRAVIMAAEPIHPVPRQYVGVSQNSSLEHNHPVGTVVTVSGAGHATVVAPTTNGRGIVAPPHFTGSDNRAVVLPPRTIRPAAPNTSNPVSRVVPVAQPVTPSRPAPMPPSVPKFDPSKSGTPVPPRPMPRPVVPGPVVPAPRPTVAPAPAPAPRPTLIPAPQPTVAPAPRPTVAPAPAPRPEPTHIAPAPRPTVAPAPAPRPTLIPAPAPRPEPTHVAPAPAPAPRPTFAPAPAPAPRPTFIPAPAPRPEPTHVAPAPAPAPRPTFAPAPAPAPRPTFIPAPAPRPEPTHVAPAPAPAPRPTFAPAPAPLPTAAPAPRPTFIPAPAPRPEPTHVAPAPAPAPRPTFIPAPAPRPEPTHVAPAPAPAPRPTFAPAPAPAPRPTATSTPAPRPIIPGPRPRMMNEAQ